MLAVEVSVNGMRRYVAGHRKAMDLTVLLHGKGAGVTGVGEPLDLRAFVSVATDNTKEFSVLPYAVDRLSVGDEVTIRIVDVSEPDPPSEASGGAALAGK